MNIGQVAERTDLPPKTIRYYEDIGLVAPGRATNGYRDYSDADTHRLAFVARTRGLGFSIDECRALLSLYDDDQRASGDVKALAIEKLAEIDRKIAEMHTLRDTLAALAKSCAGDDRPNCPILSDLAGAGKNTGAG